MATLSEFDGAPDGYGTPAHFFASVESHYGILERAEIELTLREHAMESRGRVLNKWTLSYLADTLGQKYPGFELFVVGYFGDGDAVLDFSLVRDSKGRFV